ncbi:MAG: V-type ATP synthase subunit I [Candidatus Thermoplasmatota archaeon]|nr:V-type ATP synthase subunit I [Candidatus Thermoplasmatota archaeon]
MMGSDLVGIMDNLYDSRILQVHDENAKREPFYRKDLLEIKSRLDKLVDFLEPLKDEKRGLLTLLEVPDRERIPVNPADVVKRSISFLKDAEAEMGPLRKEFERIDDDREYISEMKERLTMLTGLDLDLLAMSSLSRTIVKVGTTRRFLDLTSELSKVKAEVQGSLLDKKERIQSVRILYTRGNAKEVEGMIRGRLFSEINLDIPRLKDFLKRTTGSTKLLGLPILQIIRELEEMDDRFDTERVLLGSRGAEMADRLLPLAMAWREAAEIEMEKSNAASILEGTAYTNRISGFVEADRVVELRSLLNDLVNDRYHMEERDPTGDEISDNKVPTKLRNGRFSRLFEPLTLTFSTPRYNEIDPSMWISIPFILFFGLMLGDAGYGILLLLPSIYIYFKGEKSTFLRNIGALGILMGISTTIAGIWMGAFFGDLVPRLFFGDPLKPLFSLTIGGYQLPYNTLKDPMLLFQVSLYLGLAQLNLGFILLGVDRLRKKDLWGFVKGTISWALVQVGAVIFIGAILIGWWELNTILTVIGAATFISGAVLLIFEVGAMFLFNIEGLVGDWISYTRILALGLSTFGLAMAFNIVGEMLVDIHAAMIPLVVILLVFLHVFNLLLQTLGAAVHSVRLQFVEFFSRFFEGGGELFTPFGREREYTMVGDDAAAGGE